MLPDSLVGVTGYWLWARSRKPGKHKHACKLRQNQLDLQLENDVIWRGSCNFNHTFS